VVRIRHVRRPLSTAAGEEALRPFSRPAASGRSAP
jgi:hypothetical protein